MLVPRLFFLLPLMLLFYADVNAQHTHLHSHTHKHVHTNVQEGSAQKWSRVKVAIEGRADLAKIAALGLPLDCGVRITETAVFAEYSDREIKLLREAGFAVEILVDDVMQDFLERSKSELEKEDKDRLLRRTTGDEDLLDCLPLDFATPALFDFGSMGGYPTYEELLAHLDQMHALYPNLTTAPAAVSDSLLTAEGREVLWMKISDQPNTSAEGEPQLLYTSLHHAREPMSMMQLLFFMYYILEHYESDPDIRHLLDHTELYFVPCVNPDGYVYNELNDPDGGGMWRKNRFDNGDGSFGVDLNRNYGFHWGIDDVGSSPEPSSIVYRGTEPFSEAEAKMMRYFCNAHDFKICLNAHGYGEILLHPWGDDNIVGLPDSVSYYKLSEPMTWTNRYKFGQTFNTLGYIVNGDSDDWMYAEQEEKNKIMAFTPEVGNWNQGGFWPSPSEIVPIAVDCMPQNLLAAHMAGAYAQVSDESTLNIETLTSTIELRFERIGLFDGYDYSISIIPLTNNISSVSAPIVLNNPAALTDTLLSFELNLDPAIAAQDHVQYRISVDNGVHEYAQEITKFFQAEVAYADPDLSFNWTTDEDWGLVFSPSAVGSASHSDSPYEDYAPGTNSDYELNTVVDLTDATDAMLGFKALWEVEHRYDFVQLLASIDDGDSWQPLCGRNSKAGSRFQDEDEPIFDASHVVWEQEQISLREQVGHHVKFKFLIDSNGNTELNGFHFDDFNVYKKTTGGLGLQLSALLAGPYQISEGEMRQTLLSKDLLPLAQPYDELPWGYSGTESVGSLADFPEGTVDWVLVELRDANEAETVIEQQAALIRQDGVVMRPNGSQLLEFESAHVDSSYYVVLRHRNHLDVMSAAPISLPNVNTYNFSATDSTSLGMAQLIPVVNRYQLRSGDIDAEGTITTTDMNIYLPASSLLNVYHPADCNMDGNVTIADFNRYLPNAGVIGVNEVRY